MTNMGIVVFYFNKNRNKLLLVNNATCYLIASIFHSLTIPLLQLQILHTMQQKAIHFQPFVHYFLRTIRK